MLTVFLCHAAADSAAARALADFLECGAGVRTFVEEGRIGPGETLIEKTREGQMADVILVLLSPDSSPPRWSRDEWVPVFWDEPEARGVHVAPVLLRDCRFPDLLRRKNCFDLSDTGRDGFRTVKRWVCSLRPAVGEPAFMPAKPRCMEGLGQEIETLRRALADVAGCAIVTGPAGAGKTTLALAFAHLAREEFAAVCWASGRRRSIAGVAGDVVAQLGLRLKGDVDANLGELRSFLAGQRLLVVLDDFDDSKAVRMKPPARSSLLVTTRQDTIAGLEPDCLIRLDRAGPRPEAGAGLGGPELRLLAAMCACAPGGFGLPLAAEIAGIGEDELSGPLETLLSRLLVVELNRKGPVYMVPACVRESLEAPAAEHARAVCSLFGRAGSQPGECGVGLADLEHALGWALACGDAAGFALAGDLARSGFALATWQDRLAEAYEFMQTLSPAAEARGDRRVLETCCREREWILREWGRPEEADALSEVGRRRCSDQMSFDFAVHWPVSGE